MSRICGIAEEELDEGLILKILEQLQLNIPTVEDLAATGVIDTPLQIAQLARRARVQR